MCYLLACIDKRPQQHMASVATCCQCKHVTSTVFKMRVSELQTSGLRIEHCDYDDIASKRWLVRYDACHFIQISDCHLRVLLSQHTCAWCTVCRADLVQIISYGGWVCRKTDMSVVRFDDDAGAGCSPSNCLSTLWKLLSPGIVVCDGWTDRVECRRSFSAAQLSAKFGTLRTSYAVRSSSPLGLEEGYMHLAGFLLNKLVGLSTNSVNQSVTYKMSFTSCSGMHQI